MLYSVALKYARALVDVAAATGDEPRALKALEEFSELLRAHAGLRETYLNPAYPFAAKRRITEQIAERMNLPAMVRNFILVIIENGRMAHFDQFVSAVRQVLDDRSGLVRGTVIAAEELDPGQKVRLEESVRNLSGKDVRLEFESQPDLIGGLKLVIGSRIFDGSIRTQLETIRKSLSGD